MRLAEVAVAHLRFWIPDLSLPEMCLRNHSQLLLPGWSNLGNYKGLWQYSPKVSQECHCCWSAENQWPEDAVWWAFDVSWSNLEQPNTYFRMLFVDFSLHFYSVILLLKHYNLGVAAPLFLDQELSPQQTWNNEIKNEKLHIIHSEWAVCSVCSAIPITPGKFADDDAGLLFMSH